MHAPIWKLARIAHDLIPVKAFHSVSTGYAGLLGAMPGAAEQARAELAPLLAAAVEGGLTGFGESEASILADLLRDGLPERHLLVLVASTNNNRHRSVKCRGIAGSGESGGQRWSSCVD